MSDESGNAIIHCRSCGVKFHKEIAENECPVCETRAPSPWDELKFQRIPDELLNGQRVTFKGTWSGNREVVVCVPER